MGSGGKLCLLKFDCISFKRTAAGFQGLAKDPTPLNITLPALFFLDLTPEQPSVIPTAQVSSSATHVQHSIRFLAEFLSVDLKGCPQSTDT